MAALLPGIRPFHRVLGILLAGALLFSAPTASAQPTSITPEALSGLTFRSPGPAVTGGRIHDVEALPDDPSTVYLATASSGLWKTTNQGTTWAPIFDDQPVSTFGDIAIAPSDTDVIWAGTGEQQNRQSTSWGYGVYRSTDGGATWSHKGLVETRHIGRVRVHPDNPDVAYVAALGNLWAPSETRGVYKTTDGGATWNKVLYVDEFTGTVDLVMDPSDPNTLYAATYQRLRRTWGFNGGGPGSGIYKTTDGGATWTELTNGIPEGDKGRIGLAIAETNPDVLYATIEHAEEDGTFRSRDAGQTWTKVNELNPRPMYYSHIYVDPTNEERVYVLSYEPYLSEDGGDTFRRLPARKTYDVGVHSDHHAMWINPNNPEHFYLVGDAGLHETFDRGQTYKRINNLPIGQFYAIGIDMRDPYYIYGGMQDNHSWMGPSETRRWIGIINDDWSQIGFGDGTYMQPDPTSHRYVYVGSQNGGLVRLDAETGDHLDVEPLPPEGDDYRFDWVTPSLVSQHDPSTLYFGGNRLFISHDRGETWTHTKDLTKDVDRETLPLMGVDGDESMLSKHDGTASYGEATTIAESPLNPDILWVGTDDGNVQVSRDGGATWTEVGANIPGVDPTTYVSRVIASNAGEGVAWVTLDAHRDGDFAPYVFKTTNFGQSWTERTNGLPEMGSVNVIIEHPDNPNTLFLGTEHALFASTDGGQEWVAFMSSLPTTLYDDLKIHPREKDLVVGTHGRSIFVLDDTTPLAEWTGATAAAPAHLFSIRPASLHHFWKSTSYRGQAAYAGENPAFGAHISYHLSAPVDSVQLVVRDAEGTVVRRMTGPGTDGVIHRVTWDLAHSPPPYSSNRTRGRDGVALPETVLPELKHPTEPQGPFVAPGTYRVTLQAGDVRDTRTVEVKGDPQMPHITQAQYESREGFLVDLLAMQNRAWDAAERAEAIEDERPDSEEAATHADRLDDIRDDIYGLAGAYNRSGVTQPTLFPPTKQHRQEKVRLQQALADALDAFEDFAPDEQAD
jgi:photosystem II stability/assembly factor-like uncharacterized protein